MPRAVFGLILLVMCAVTTGAPAAALAYPVTRITPSFSSDRLGAGTSISVAGVTTDTSGGLPAPIQEAIFHLPPGLGVHTTGFQTCQPSVLTLEGPAGCPAGSIAGPLGSAIGKAPLGGSVITEPTTIQPFLAPPDASGHSRHRSSASRSRSGLRARGSSRSERTAEPGERRARSTV
jgi:hypothetical protein